MLGVSRSSHGARQRPGEHLIVAYHAPPMIVYQRQPTRRTCGQTVCAMLAGVDVAVVIAETRRGGTSGADLIRWLRGRGFVVPDAPRRFAFDRRAFWVDPASQLPRTALVRVDWASDRRRTHWILWAEGRFWDPSAPIIHGVDDGFAWLARGGRVYSIVPVERPVAF